MTDEQDATPTSSSGSPGTLDAWGRPRSSRSIPTGLGSRGGTWHLPEARRAYFRQYRKDHPDYRRREEERSRRRKREARQRRHEELLTLTQVLRLMVDEECKRTSRIKFADRTGLDIMTVRTFLWETRNISGDTMEAIIDYFSLWRVHREWSRQVKLARERARNGRLG